MGAFWRAAAGRAGRILIQVSNEQTHESNSISGVDRSDDEERRRPRGSLPRVQCYGRPETFGEETLHGQIEAQTEKGKGRLAIHIGPIERYRPVRNAFNCLVVATGLSDVPKDWLPRFRQADALLTPSRFCSDAAYRVSDSPVFQFEPGFRQLDVTELDGDFRWLVIIDDSLYPLWPIIARSWTIDTPVLIRVLAQDKIPSAAFEHGRVDFGPTSYEELSLLVSRSHAIVYFAGTMDGSGILAAQLKSCGRPCITTRYGGQVDYDFHWPIEHELIRVPLRYGESIAHDGKYAVAVPKKDALMDRVRFVMNHYEKLRARSMVARPQGNVADIISGYIERLL